MERTPRVTATWAQSIDGRIATASGSSQWISGDATLELAHRLRAEHDAILVGVGTVLADDPRLTCRTGGRSPHRYVLDAALRTPADSNIARLARDVPTTILCSDALDRDRARELEAAGVEIVVLGADDTEPGVTVSAPTVAARSGHSVLPGDTRLAMAQAMAAVATRGARTLLVEGGSRVLTSLFAERRVDRLVLVSAPMVIGHGTDAIGDLDVVDLAQAIRGRTLSVGELGGDLVWEVVFGAP